MAKLPPPNPNPMNRSTRSAINLPGDIHQYLGLQNNRISETMTNPEESDVVDTDTGTDAITAMVTQLSGDPTKLCELLATNLKIAAESQSQMQKMIQNQSKIIQENQQSRTTTGSSFSYRVDDCPTKRKYSSLEAWLEEVELWDETHTNTDNPANINAKKYLKFMASVRDAEDSDELKQFVQVEFVENQTFDKKSVTIIKDIITKIKEKLDKTDLEKCSEAWMKFIRIKQEKDESSQSFVVRFEQTETQLKNVKIKIPNKALAIHLLNSTNLESQSKENILTKTNLDEDDKIYGTLKKSIREMKGQLTQNSKEVVEKDGNRTYFGDRERSQSRFNNRRPRSFSRAKSSGHSDSSRWPSKTSRTSDSDKSWRTGRTYDRRNDGFKKGNNDWRDSRGRSSSRKGRSRDHSRDNRNRSHRDRDVSRSSGTRPQSSEGEVNMVHFSKYDFKDNDNKSEFKDYISGSAKDIDLKIVEVIYSEGNCDVDPYRLVVDCGCPKTVTGKPWMDAFIESKGDILVKREKEDELFRFGPSDIYRSDMNYEIEVCIGKLKEKIKVSVVDADIPLLLGIDYQEKWGMMIDMGNKEINIRKSQEKFKIKNNLKHWTLPIQNNSLHREAKNLVFKVDTEPKDDKTMRKLITKIHKNLSHKSESQLLKLYKMAGKDTKQIRAIVKDVVSTCNICNRFRKTPPRPKVALAKANTTNEVVSVDLKEFRDLKKYVLYMCDEFSGFMVAQVISDKNPETIIKALDTKWVKEGPGIPSKGLFADNGGEFKNPELKEVAAKFGITLNLTAGRSPWSNGKVEREHFTCDLIVEKLMEEDSKLKLDEAVSLAVYSKNLQINRTGFSPRQLMFGKQGVVPGITDGNPASWEPIVESDVFRREFINRQKAEELFRKYDSNERIQKILAQNTYGYSDQKYQEGEMVYFKEEGKNRWSGPAKVTGMEGSKVRIIHAGYDRTVPACRVIPYKRELEIVDDDTNNGHEDDDAGITTVGDDTSENVDNVTAIEFEEPQVELRPKLNKEIKFKVSGENSWRNGKVFKVGKKTGKDKFRAWIRMKNMHEDSYDFSKDIAAWKYAHITFNDVSEEAEDENHESTASSDTLYTGVWFLQNKKLLEVNEKLENEVNDVFKVEIPKKYHDHPEIVESKKDELTKWKEYEAYEEVELDGQPVISTRWVVTEKPSGKPKSRLVVRGFEEKISPQSDSPTVSKDSCKMFLSIAANEGFAIGSLDVASAFLQGQPLTREVYVRPPIEARNEGKIWRLKKTCYGLYDASRSWYMAVREQLLSLGMKTLSGDDALFFLVKKGKLLGMCLVHVDDFLVGGNPEFDDILEKGLMSKFTFGKVESKKFKYIGLNVEQRDEGIFIDQNEYIQSLQPIEIEKAVDKNAKLPKDKFTEYRALTGQLSWAAENTRPDLCFDVRELSTRNKDASYSDLKKANKALKKAQKENLSIKFSRLGNISKLKVLAYTDSSYRNDEMKVKSVGGRCVLLTNEEGDCSPLAWKSKTIQQVCKSVKTAETRSLERGIEDAIYLARMLNEIYTGKVSESQVPVEIKIDSKTLLDSIGSTKQVDEKTIRHLVAWIKQQKEEGKVRNIDWVCSEEMLADIFTKSNVKSNAILSVMSKGKLSTN